MARAEQKKQTEGGATQVCPTCGQTVVPDNGYCPECGSPMTAAPQADGAGQAAAQEAALQCPVCGSPVRADAEYCPTCGVELAGVTGKRPAAPTGGPSLEEAIKCAVCRETIPAGEEFCPSCGAPRSASSAQPEQAQEQAQAEPDTKSCPSCGATLRANAKFCRECGHRFTDVAPKATQVQSGLYVGQVLAGRYRIVKPIGGGGMGTVFRGVDVNLKTRESPEGRPVAVKAIINSDDPELLQAAVEEREMLIRLDHPNIVRIYDIVTEGGIPYIVMAFVKGTSWKELYDKNGGPLSEAEAVRLLLGIRGAFEYLHGRTPPVVYRDFKPGNVIQVDEPGGNKRQVLIDLGTAVEYIPGQKHQAWGTIGFAPPEIGGVVEQPPTMDLFGIVSTLAALLGVDVAEQMIEAPPRYAWPVSQEIYDFVMRGRSPDPRVRFQTVGELFDQLEGIQRFVLGDERARLAGAPHMRGRTTNPISQPLVPVQSTIFIGRLATSITGRIGALPALSVTDPATQFLQPARDLLSAGRYDEALTQVEAALRTHPASIDGHLLRAAALNNLGRVDEARQELAQAERLSTPATRWRTLLVQAQAAEAHGDFQAAETLYKELISLVPGEVLPKQALADIYRETGRYDKAADMYSRVVNADPANADAVLGWADSLVALNQTDTAIGVLDAVNEHALRYVDAQLRLIELYVARIHNYLNNAKGGVSQASAQDMLRDLTLAGRAIRTLSDRTESRHFYRLQADWWYAAYRIAKMKLLPQNMEWPDGRQHKADDPHGIGQATREAYRRYLQRAPDAPDREDVLARIYFDVEEWH